MPLDPQAQALLDQIAASGQLPRHLLPVHEARRQAHLAFIAGGGAPAPVARVEDRRIPGPEGDLLIRIYTPPGDGPFPALVYFHGGGWVLASIETHDSLCRTLANEAGVVVLAVEYSLAPEHKFPLATEECYAATLWTASNALSVGIDPARIAVGGDSAGGNLAAVVALMARDRGNQLNLAFQLLIYPVTDYYLPGTPSYQENAEGYYLPRETMIWYWNAYLPDEAHATNPYASPLQASDLSGLPPALIITAEFDPLRDEGEMYAARLQKAGVPTKLSRYDGMIHGFVNMAGIMEQGQRARLEAAHALKTTLH